MGKESVQNRKWVCGLEITFRLFSDPAVEHYSLNRWHRATEEIPADLTLSTSTCLVFTEYYSATWKTTGKGHWRNNIFVKESFFGSGDNLFTKYAVHPPTPIKAMIMQMLILREQRQNMHFQKIASLLENFLTLPELVEYWWQEKYCKNIRNYFQPIPHTSVECESVYDNDSVNAMFHCSLCLPLISTHFALNMPSVIPSICNREGGSVYLRRGEAVVAAGGRALGGSSWSPLPHHQWP